MAVVVVLDVTAKAGTGSQLLALFRRILPDTRARKGFQAIEVSVNLDNPDNLILIERWDSRADYEAYLGWRKERGDLDNLGAALAGPPAIRYFEPTDA